MRDFQRGSTTFWVIVVIVLIIVIGVGYYAFSNKTGLMSGSSTQSPSAQTSTPDQGVQSQDSYESILANLISNWKSIAPSTIPGYPRSGFYGYPHSILFIDDNKIILTYETDSNVHIALLYYYKSNFTGVESSMTDSDIISVSKTPTSQWIKQYGPVKALYVFSSNRTGETVYPSDWVKQ